MTGRVSKKISWFITVAIGVTLGAGIGEAWYCKHVQLSNSGESTRVLKLGHGLSSEHPVHRAMVYMAERVQKLSRGRLVLHIYPSGMIGSEPECFKQIQNGV